MGSLGTAHKFAISSKDWQGSERPLKMEDDAVYSKISVSARIQHFCFCSHSQISQKSGLEIINVTDGYSQPTLMSYIVLGVGVNIQRLYVYDHPELSGCITTLLVRNEVANFCAAMDTLIDQDGRPIRWE